MCMPHKGVSPSERHLSIVVVGASGDLAVKKTFPALLSLYAQNLLPRNLHIVGYARSKIKDEDYLKKISSKFSNDIDKKVVDQFLSVSSYISGQYDSEDDYKRLHQHLQKLEKGSKKANRIFYFAIPPNVF